MSCYICIRRADLEAKGACPAGLALFDSILAEQNDLRARRGKVPRVGKIRIPWCPLSWLWLSQHGNHQSWMYDHGLVPMPSFQRANLRGAYLDGAYLRGANLRGANLRGADLRGADLDGASLIRASFDGAHLDGAHLGGANLRGADLRGANLGDWERGPDGYARRKGAQ